MAMPANGLIKLIEEAGELQQIVGKKLAYYYTDDHPDGKGSLKERLEDELADVMAMSMYVIDHHGLDDARIDLRVSAKLKQYGEWDLEGESQ